jgi:(2Fe-2S) ferredoxin
MNEIKKHVFVCVNERNERNPKGCCASKDSLEIMTQLKRTMKDKGIKDIRVNKSGCLGCCENGISCVIYPEGTWYTIPNNEKSILEISESIINGEISKKYLMYSDK